METSDELKKLVKEKYGQIAEQTGSPQETSCCGNSSCCDTIEFSVMADDYSQLEGYNPDADLGLGCGLPTEHAMIKAGDIVVDLGSGAGNDCFVARSMTGEGGKVIGVDMTTKMVDKARANAEKLGYHNVEFILGDIENIPLPDNTADVAVSNCVMNLVPDKEKAFKETFRILKPGGHFSISDIVIIGSLPENLKKDAEMYAGCVAGAIEKEVYLKTIEDAGFRNVRIQKEKNIVLPNEILEKFPDIEGIGGSFGIFSITVYGEK
jgi:arsenite methyltransferase